MMYDAVRRIGFLLPPETAHRVALRAVRVGRPLARLRSIRSPNRWVDALGLTFRNPVGLAAGYDKDGVAWPGLGALGFGHVEIGTVTPRPQAGNPRPRLHRLTKEQALVNRLGFPSVGAALVVGRIGEARPDGIVVGVSIGPNAGTAPERRIDDYRELVDVFAPVADYLAINVSSPNTAGLRDLEEPERLHGMVSQIVAHRNQGHGSQTPLVVKLSPDAGRFGDACRAAVDAGAAGLIVGNTTLQRDLVSGAVPEGGISGRPLAEVAMRCLEEAVAVTSVPVIACGGIMSASDAHRRLDAGARLIQIYTGLVYRGPRLIREILAGVPESGQSSTPG